MTTDIVEALRDVLRPRKDVRLVLLFGSCARGSAGDRSDVDLALVGGEADPLALGAELSIALGREVEVVRVGDDPGVVLLEALVRDGIPVAEAWAGAFALWRSRALTQLETDRPGFAHRRDAWLRRVAERGV